MIEQLKKYVKDGAIGIISASIINKVFSLVSSIFVVRILTQGEYGSLSYVENAYSYILLLSGFGLGNALLRYIPIENDENQKRLILKYALSKGTIIQAVVTIPFIAAFLLIAEKYEHVVILTFLFILKPVFQYIYDTFQYYYRARENNKRYAVLSVVFMGSTVLAMIVFAKAVGVLGIPFARYVSYSVVLGWIFLITKRHKECETVGELSKDVKNEILKYGISLTIATMLSSILPSNDLMIISNITKSEIDLAFYKVALVIPLNLTFITNSILIYIYPKFVKMSNDGKWILRNASKVSGVCAVIIIPVVLLFYCLAPQLLNWIYGADYIGAAKLMRMLLIAIGFNACFRMMPMSLLAAIGFARENALIAFITVLVQIVLDYLLISRYGVIGAPIALLCLYFATACVYWLVLIKKCRRKKNGE